MDPLRTEVFQSAFNPVALVNAIVSAGSSSASAGAASEAITGVSKADSALSGAIVRLQLMSQDYNAQADADMARIVAALPRTKRDAASLSQSAPALTSQLKQVLQNQRGPSSIRDVVQDPAGSSSAKHYLKELELLDTVAARLQAVQAGLGAAVSWDRLFRESADVFAIDSSSLPRMAQHISALESAAEALKDMPDAEKRDDVVADARKHFASAVRPQLTSALSGGDVDGLRSVICLFRSMGRLDAITTLLAGIRIAPLIDAWRSFGAGNTTTASAAASPAANAAAAELSGERRFRVFLRRYYAAVVSVIAAEAPALAQYFLIDKPSDSETAAPRNDDNGMNDAVACLAAMASLALGSSATSSSPSSTSSLLLSPPFSASRQHDFDDANSLPSAAEFRQRIEADCGSAGLDVDVVVQLHAAATQSADQIVALFNSLPAASPAAIDLKRAAVTSAFNSIVDVFGWYREQLGELEKEALHDAIASTPHLRMPLPPSIGDGAGVLSAAAICSLVGISSQPPAAFVTLAPGMQPPPISLADVALAAADEAARRFALLAPSSLSRCEALTGSVESASVISAYSDCVIDLAQRTYGTATALHDAAVLPLILAVANQRSVLTAGSGAAVLGVGGVSRGGAPAAAATPAFTKAAAPAGSPVLLPPVREVYPACMRTWLLSADLLVLLMALDACAVTAIAAKVPMLQQILSAEAGGAALLSSFSTYETSAALRARPAKAAALKDLLAISSQSAHSSSGASPSPSNTMSRQSRAASVASSILSTSITDQHVDAGGLLLSDAAAAVRTSSMQCARVTYECLLAPVASHVRGVQSMSCWHQTAAALGGAATSYIGSGGGDSDDPLDDAFGYSVQPNQYVSEISSYLMELVQLVAPHGHPLVQAEQKAALTGIQTPPGRVVIGTGAQSGAAVTEQLDVPFAASVSAYASQTAAAVPHLGNAEVAAVYASIGATAPSSATGQASVGPLATLTAAANAFDTACYRRWASHAAAGQGCGGGAAVVSISASEVATAAVTLWLHAVVKGAGALLLHEYLRIPSIDNAGIRQLRADVDYFTAVLSSMGIGVDPMLSQLVELVSMPGRELAALDRVASAGGAGDDMAVGGSDLAPATAAALRKTVVAMRKIAGKSAP